MAGPHSRLCLFWVVGSMYVKVPVDILRIVWGALNVGVVVYVVRGLIKV